MFLFVLRFKNTALKYHDRWMMMNEYKINDIKYYGTNIMIQIFAFALRLSRRFFTSYIIMVFE